MSKYENTKTVTYPMLTKVLSEYAGMTNEEIGYGLLEVIASLYGDKKPTIKRTRELIKKYK